MIYFIQQEGGGPIKIGFTRKAKLDQRLHQLQVSNPLPLQVLFAMCGCKKAEAGLHLRFDYARASGEWFHPVPELLDHIDRMRGTKHPREGSLLSIFLRSHGLETGYDGHLPTLWEMALVVFGEACDRARLRRS